MRVIGAVEPNLRKVEIERARRKRPENVYDLFLRALPFAATAMPADADKALRLLEKAVRLEPDYAIVHGFIAWCHEQRYLRGGLHAETRAAALAGEIETLLTKGVSPTEFARKLGIGRSSVYRSMRERKIKRQPAVYRNRGLVVASSDVHQCFSETANWEPSAGAARCPRQR